MVEKVKTITATLCNVEDIFTKPNYIFRIPIFQRRFVWDKNNVRDMFDDFAEDTNNYSVNIKDLSGYMLGSVVLIDSEEGTDEYIVVDGQQRLTVLTLIFKALNFRLDKIGREALVNNKNLGENIISYSVDARNIYSVRDRFHEYTGYRIRYDKDLSFYQIYQDILNDKYDELSVSHNKDDNNLLESWYEINDYISQMIDKDVITLFKYLCTKVQIIKTTTPSESKAFQLFEVLNVRGKTLEPLDLIKNELLKRLDTDSSLRNADVNLFKNNWEKFEDNITGGKNSNQSKNPSSTFLRYFIMMKYGRDIRKGDLFDFFKKEKMDNDKINNQGYYIKGMEIIEFSKEINKYSKIYKSIIDNPSENEFSNSDEMFILFKLLNIKQLHPILMLFYFENGEIREEVLKYCLRMGIGTVFSFTNANSVLPEIVNFIKKFRSVKDFNEGLELIISDIEKYNFSKAKLIRELLSEREMSKSKATDLLKTIELIVNGDSSIRRKAKYGEKIELEHIFPQNPPANVDITNLGIRDDNELELFTNMIGNLTLLTSSENKEASNGMFYEKKTIYSESKLDLTKAIVGKLSSFTANGKHADFIREILEYEKSYVDAKFWDKNYIEKRSKDISNLVADIVLGNIR